MLPQNHDTGVPLPLVFFQHLCMWALFVKKIPALLLFQTLRLLFFPNLPTPMFIPDPKFISDPRVISTNTTILKSKLFCHLKEDKTK